MTTEVTTSTVPSVWTMLVSIIDRPRQTFEAVVSHPRRKWVLPLVLAAITAIILAWVAAPYTAEMAQNTTLQQLTQNKMTPDEAQKVLDQTAQFRTPMFLGLVGSVTGALMVGIVWVAMAGLFYFLSLVVGAEELTFGTVFNVVAWSSIPLTLRNLVQAAVIGILGKFPVYAGLSALQASGDNLKDAGNPLFALLTFADIFWLWHFSLLVIGLAVCTKFSRKKAFFIALIYALIAIGLAVGATFLSRGGAS